MGGGCAGLARAQPDKARTRQTLQQKPDAAAKSLITGPPRQEATRGGSRKQKRTSRPILVSVWSARGASAPRSSSGRRRCWPAQGLARGRASLIIRNRLPSGDTSYVRGDVVSGADVVRPINQLGRRARGPRGTAPHTHAHERAIGREVEELLAVPRPQRLRAATGGHLPSPLVHVRKRPHGNLKLPRVVGLGTPATGRRVRSLRSARRTAFAPTVARGGLSPT